VSLKEAVFFFKKPAFSLLLLINKNEFSYKIVLFRFRPMLSQDEFLFSENKIKAE